MCARCAAPLRLAKETSIEWDDTKKQFEVRIAGSCAPCGWQEELVLKRMPLLIAESSSCSCGKTLILADHSFSLSSNDLEFKAIYRCVSCETEKHSLVSRILQALKFGWQEITSVEVGLTGLKMSKRGKSGDAL